MRTEGGLHWKSGKKYLINSSLIIWVEEI